MCADSAISQATPQLFAVKLRPAVKTKAAAKGDMTRREEDAKRCRLLYLPPGKLDLATPPSKEMTDLD